MENIGIYIFLGGVVCANTHEKCAGVHNGMPMHGIGISMELHVPTIYIKCCYTMVYVPGICLWCCRLLFFGCMSYTFCFFICFKNTKIYLKHYRGKGVG